MKNGIPTFEDIQEIRGLLLEQSFQHWYHDEFLSLNWWFLLISTIVPYYLWWKLVDKERVFEIFTYGLLCSVAACILDVIGVDMLLWAYPDKLLFTIPPLLPADIVVIPVTAMLIYQYFTSWKSFFAAALGLAFLFSYIIEPIFIKIHLYKLYHWKHTYSFIGFLILFIGIRLLVVRITSSVEKSRLR